MLTIKMNKLYGLIVTRSKHGSCKFPVWCISEEAREERKKFILEKVSCLDYDGSTSFEHVESEVLIKEVGAWLKLESGNYLYIVNIEGVSCYGYIFKKKRLPKIIPESCKHLWLYTNGNYYHNQDKKAILC